MILAYIIYFFILLFLTGSAYLAKRKREYAVCSYELLIPLLLVSVLMGFRYDVGTDWEQYKIYYTDILDNGLAWSKITSSTLEPLYLILNASIAFWGIPYQGFFAIIMFLHLFLLYKSFDYYKFLLPLGIFFYVTTLFCTSLNIQRQTLSICIFLFSLRYILNRQFLKYFICVAVAAMTHYSSFILFPIYFLAFDSAGFLNKRWVQIALYISSFFVFNIFLDWIMNVVSLYVPNAKYLSNLSALGNRDMDVASGLGILANYVIDIILILFSNKLGRIYKSIGFNVLFRIFFIGVCLSNTFSIDVFLSRLPLALESLRFIILAFLTHYLFSLKKIPSAYYFGIAIVSLYFFMFVFAIKNGASGCSPFQFA